MDARASQPVDRIALATDVQQILEYRRDAVQARLLPYGLWLFALGLLMFMLLGPVSLRDANWDQIEGILAGVVLVLAGAGLAVLALWRRWNHGQPLFVLEPAGIHVHTWPSAFIPWREVRGIDTVQITFREWWRRHSREIIFENVTVVLVSKTFYAANIDLGSLLLRGPYWPAFFIPKRDVVQVALHHEMTSVMPEEVRVPVEARWQAFRAQPPTTGVPVTRRARRKMPRGVAMSPDPRPMSAWEPIKVGVPLVVVLVLLSNLLGVWSTKDQVASRVAAQAAAEQSRRYKEERRRQDEESRKLQENLERNRKDFDDTMRRTFGR
jgi:hypothetical protein